MASVKKSEIPEVAAYMTDIWEYIKSAWIIEDKDEYWDQVVHGIHRLMDQYHDPFCQGMTLWVLSYIEERAKKKYSQMG